VIPGEPVFHARERSDHTRALPLYSAARAGSCTVAFLRRGVPLPNGLGPRRGLAGRLVSSLVVRRRSWGSSLRRFTPVTGGRHLCRPGPTCRLRPSPAPIDFRRGDPPARSELWLGKRKGERIGGSWRSTSGLRSHLRSAPAVVMATGRDPALGFASCRVVGHEFVHSPGIDPGADHQPPAVGTAIIRRHCLSAHGL